VGDGGEAAFEAELERRTPPEAAARAAELDERAMRGEGTPEDIDESLRLLWHAYFASPDDTPPYVSLASSPDAYSGLWDSLKAELPRLEAALPSVRVPLGVVAGGASPMPVEAAAAVTARAIPGAWLDVVEGAGHFPYYERPGCVRAGLERLTGAR
jgi:pimeloyl-ACP methyl ester carboxylesterase